MATTLRQRISSLWRRFRQWQRNPVSTPPRDDNDQHVCLNCDESYEGSYCPRCGQSAKVRQLTMKNALSGFFDVWGLGSRSMPRALYHLMFRPGYMIADYLRGHRQPYFPPFKMLFVLTATAIILSNILPSTSKEEPKQAEVTATYDDENNDTEELSEDRKETEKVHKRLDYYWDTVMKNIPAPQAVLLLGWQLLFAIGTTMFFRKSPRMGRLTFTEQFYSQVIIAGQMQFFSIIYMLLVFAGNKSYEISVPEECVAAFALIDYKQLYGYRWWGTIWRSLCVSIMAVIALILVVVVATIIIVASNP